MLDRKRLCTEKSGGKHCHENVAEKCFSDAATLSELTGELSSMNAFARVTLQMSAIDAECCLNARVAAVPAPLHGVYVFLCERQRMKRQKQTLPRQQAIFKTSSPPHPPHAIRIRTIWEKTGSRR
jgi:hypothetical protein